MKAPSFWHKKTLISYLLIPLSFIYGLGVVLRYLLTRTVRVTKPVICIGNLVAGGAGKTPVAIEIGKILKELGVNFAYLSYGYGRDSKDFIQVKSNAHNVNQVGDEPILLSEIADTFVTNNRVLGAQKIDHIQEKQMIILDDGFQNSALFKNLHILVIDGFYGFGNKMLIPSGPMRELILTGSKRADIVIIIGQDRFNSKRYFTDTKIVNANLKVINANDFKDNNMVAFCGIGRPKKFFYSLKDEGIKVVKQISYADHYLYKKKDLDYLLDLAKKNNAKLITTKKDWVRIDPSYQKQIGYLDIKIEFDNANLIKEELQRLL